MKSYEVIQKDFEKVAPKEVASDMKVGVSLVQKWGREPEVSGFPNPGDKFVQLLVSLKSLRLLHWANEQFHGFYVANPQPSPVPESSKLAVSEVVEVQADYDKALAAVMKPGGRTPQNKAHLRGCWERMKSVGEGFVLAAEQDRLLALLLAGLNWLVLQAEGCGLLVAEVL